MWGLARARRAVLCAGALRAGRRGHCRRAAWCRRYTYKKAGRDTTVVYFWQGRHSSADEKGASGLHAKDIAAPSNAPQVRRTAPSPRR